MMEIARWPGIVADAREKKVEAAGIGTLASWGSNFLGDFTVDSLMSMLEAQHRMWDAVGIRVVSCAMVDPMSHCTPTKVEESITRIKERWPEIRNFRLHLHNARNMALVSAYAAMRCLGPEDTLELDGTIGGIGGCPYCGNGRVTGMIPTEDLFHMLEGMGIETGVDIDKLIGCVWMAEEILGRELYGRVSKTGPRPGSVEELYDLDMPFVETPAQARHFKIGPDVYEGCLSPYTEPIASPYRDRVEKGLLPFDPPGGEFPWQQEWFPAKQKPGSGAL
jgi:hydroxymethylglutaryl-CoA lyase